MADYKKFRDFMNVKEGVVRFKKMNGDIRNMRFSTSVDIIPENMHPKSVNVWDLDKKSYRTIKLASIVGEDEVI